MIRRAYAQTCSICGGIHVGAGLAAALVAQGPVAALSDQTGEEYAPSKAFLNLIKKVFKGDIDGIDEPTALDNAQTFMSGVFEGYGGNFASFEWGSPDYRKLAHIEHNVYTFSGAKNYQQLRFVFFTENIH